MKVLVLGDIGVIDGVIHIGDEAMVDALFTELSPRIDAEFTVMSSVPDDVAQRFGVASVGLIGFAGADTDGDLARDDRRERIIASAGGATGLIDWQDPAWAAIEAVAASDAVVIAGGGNLTSTWPQHVYERATLAELARIFAKPLVVGSQTLGPALTSRHRELVSGILDSAQLVGVRERASKDIATIIAPGALVHLTVDDAAFLAAPRDDDPTASPPIAGPYCLATFSAHTGSAERAQFARAAAAFLDDVSAVTGLPVVLLGHEGSVEAGIHRVDDLLHEEISRLVTIAVVVSAPMASPRASAALARGAALVVTSRHHPAVFASAAAVPTIGITVDSYTDTKITAALDHFGQAGHSLPALALLTGDARALLERVWATPSSVRDSRLALIERRRADAAAWWDAVAGALSGTPAPEYLSSDPFDALPEPLDAVSAAATTTTTTTTADLQSRERVERLRSWMRSDSDQRTGIDIEVRAERELIASLEVALARAENRAGQLHADLLDADQHVRDAESALVAAHRVAAELGDPLVARALTRDQPIGHTSELEALLASRTYRWSRRPRLLYSRLRHAFLT